MFCSMLYFSVFLTSLFFTHLFTPLFGTDTYSELVPMDGPPSFRGQAVKYVYKLTIGCQRVNSPIKLLRVPFRVLVLHGRLDKSSTVALLIPFTFQLIFCCSLRQYGIVRSLEIPSQSVCSAKHLIENTIYI